MGFGTRPHRAFHRRDEKERQREREREGGRGTSIPTPQMITLRPSTNWPATLRVSVDQQGDTGRGVDVRGRS